MTFKIASWINWASKNESKGDTFQVGPQVCHRSGPLWNLNIYRWQMYLPQWFPDKQTQLKSAALISTHLSGCFEFSEINVASWRVIDGIGDLARFYSVCPAVWWRKLTNFSRLNAIFAKMKSSWAGLFSCKRHHPFLNLFREPTLPQGMREPIVYMTPR